MTTDTISHDIRLSGDIGIGLALLCPRCGDNYLHHGEWRYTTARSRTPSRQGLQGSGALAP